MAPAEQTVSRPGGSADQRTSKYAYIDAVRGWAILLVMTGHVGDRFAELPYPIKKLTNYGWFGVQMFFLASAVTLALSWSRDTSPLPRKVADFFIRRFLRIAPMYYAGAVLYSIAAPPPSGFSAGQLARALLFFNAWSPAWIPTTVGWMVVPGGWSIGVEFTFYALFPVLILVLTTLRRATLFALATVPFAIAANIAGARWFGAYGEPALSRFLYFWFPNQLPVFAIGLVLYHWLQRARSLQISCAAAYALIATAGLACTVSAEIPSIDRFTLHSPPQVLIATCGFAVFIAVLAKSRSTLFVHPALQRLGTLSFSCYVLHFLFVSIIPKWSGGVINTAAPGVRAVLMFMVLWAAVIGATCILAAATHRWLEQPFIRLAQRITGRRGAVRHPMLGLDPTVTLK